MSTPTPPRPASLHAPELSAEHVAEIEAMLANEHSDWRPSGAPTGITFTDIFCGFGGSSIGLENAGMSLVLGANHWQKAIETHALNFPDADHLIADVSNDDMRRLPATEVLWASPICTELSPAGGTRRRDAQLSLLEPEGHVPTAALDRTRATFWDVVRATEVHRYKVVLIENVVEAASGSCSTFGSRRWTSWVTTTSSSPCRRPTLVMTPILMPRNGVTGFTLPSRRCRCR